jgi:hypothetical protein
MIQAHRVLLKWARTLHVYLTMFGFMLLLFFAVTGFMLNHESWFLPAETTEGKIPTDCTATREAVVERLTKDFNLVGDVESYEINNEAKSLRVVFKSTDNLTGRDISSVAVIDCASGATVVTHDSDRSRIRIKIVDSELPKELLAPDDRSKDLLIVEKLRKDFGVRGEADLKYEDNGKSCCVRFKSPGYEAEAVIDVNDGKMKVTHRSRGINGILLDLHRGKESGKEWSFIIDGVAILFVIVSITGLILWSSLRSRAQHGFMVLMLGAAIGFAIYFIYVPR